MVSTWCSRTSFSQFGCDASPGINESKTAANVNDNEKSISPYTPLHPSLAPIRKAAEEKAKKQAEIIDQSLNAARTRSGKDYHN